MTMANLSFLQKHKSEVDHYLLEFLREQSERTQEHPKAKEIFAYLENFCQNGKGIRGALFLDTLELSGLSPAQLREFLPAAAALELTHSGLLIQDDWMDHDSYRRGQATFHTQLKTVNPELPQDYVAAATNCAADIIFFLAFELLNRVNNPQFTKSKTLILQEYVSVGFAQWQEIFLSYQNSYQLADIEQIYRYKTARYTFVMPILAALLTQEITPQEVKKIEKIAENLGMIFQITDDRLNIFGKSQETKKAVGSDITDNKKTYYHFFFHQLLQQNPDSLALQKIKNFFGKKNLTAAELQLLQKTFAEFAITKSVDELLFHYQRDCHNAIDDLQQTVLKQRFTALLEYLLERKA